MMQLTKYKNCNQLIIQVPGNPTNRIKICVADVSSTMLYDMIPFVTELEY